MSFAAQGAAAAGTDATSGAIMLGELSRSGARRADPRVTWREQDAEATPLTVFEELVQRDGLPVVRAQLACDIRGDVSGLNAPVRIPDRDCVRIVLVVRLRNERKLAARREPLVLELVDPERDDGNGHDADTWVVVAHHLLGCRVAHPVAGAGALEPESKPLGRHDREGTRSARTLSGRRYDKAAQNAATSPGFPTSGDRMNATPGWFTKSNRPALRKSVPLGRTRCSTTPDA